MDHLDPSSKCTTRMVTRQTCIRSDAPSNQLNFRPCFTVLCTHTCGMASVGFFTEAKLQEHFIYKAAAECVAKDEAYTGSSVEALD